MKIIYFKRAGTNQKTLHPLFITEYTAAEHLNDAQKAERESLIEEHFLLELAKNDDRHKQHLDELKKQEESALKAEQDAQVIKNAEEKQLLREFEQFKRWKQNQKGNK